MVNEKVAVLGTGSWGTVLASLLLENGNQVVLWGRREEIVNEINEQHTNNSYLPEISLNPQLKATISLELALLEASAVIFVIPSQYMRETVQTAKHYIKKDSLLVHASKGFEQGTGKRLSQVLHEEIGALKNIAVLSGPSHAEEVIMKCPTAVVASSEEESTSAKVQALFKNEYFRVYTNTDVIGVEVGGALKNIIAIAAGLVDGLNFGDNTKAALLTRGIAEIARLGVKMGAKPYTFAGLTGVGDLIATCVSRHSRNWTAGYMLSQGKSLPEVLSQMNMVVEGVKTVEVVQLLAKKYEVQLPLSEQIYNIIYRGKNPTQAVFDLMTRGSGEELSYIYGL